MARTWGRKGRPFVRAQRQCFAEETHCCLCGGWVNQAMPNPRDRMARSVHHLVPPDIAPELANDRGNMRLAHFGCNARYGRGPLEGQGPKGGRPATRGRVNGVRGVRVARHARVVPRRSPVSTDRDW